MNVCSATPLDAVDYHERGDGLADVRLRRNVRQAVISLDSDAPDQTVYVADEAYIVTASTRGEVDATFDDLWAEAEMAKKSPEERIADLESQLADAEMAILETYALATGGE